MAKAHLIKPFPTDIDREAFGHWLSGFTDGEGCFFLVMSRNGNVDYPSAWFSIRLRSDDAEILKLIQSYFDCGVIRYAQGKIGNEEAALRIDRSAELHNVIIPHFERFPLRAKKRRDFVIWKEAVSLLYTVRSRKRISLGNLRGVMQKWTAEEKQQFEHFRHSLKAQRQFQARDQITPPHIDDGLPLFD